MSQGARGARLRPTHDGLAIRDDRGEWNMIETRVTLSEQARQSAAMELQASLVELLDLVAKGKQAHWNLFGPGFITIHRLLDELIEEYRELADSVAERCVTVGVAPDGLPRTVATASRLPDMPPGRIQDRQAVELMADCLSETCKRVRQRCEHLAQIDLVTQNLLIEVAAKLEKQLWMLQSKLM